MHADGEIREQASGPGAGGDDDDVAIERASIACHHGRDAPAGLAELDDFSAREYICTLFGGGRGQRASRRSRGDVAANAFHEVAGVHVGELRKLLPNVVGVQPARLIPEVTQTLVAVAQRFEVGLRLQSERPGLPVKVGA